MAPNTEHVFFAYGAAANFIRNMDLILDTDGDGDLNDEVAMLIGSAATDMTTSNDAFFASVVTDATGSILGRATGIGAQQGFNNEANWGGFQIASPMGSVAEPTPLVLLGLGLAVIAAGRGRVLEKGWWFNLTEYRV